MIQFISSIANLLGTVSLLEATSVKQEIFYYLKKRILIMLRSSLSLSNFIPQNN